MYRFPIFVLKSGLSTKRKKNSYTICKCGQANSRTGSSSSGSNASPVGLTWGGMDLNKFVANYTSAMSGLAAFFRCGSDMPPPGEYHVGDSAVQGKR